MHSGTPAAARKASLLAILTFYAAPVGGHGVPCPITIHGGVTYHRTKMTKLGAKIPRHASLEIDQEHRNIRRRYPADARRLPDGVRADGGEFFLRLET